MSSFPAANLITRLSFTPQSRLLSLPWMKRNVIRCFSHKGGGPQSPVRYIPKKFRDDVGQPQCSSSEDHKSHKDAIRPSSNFRIDKPLDRTEPEGSRKSWIDHEHSNLSFHYAHAVNEDVKRGHRAAEAMSLKPHQEDVQCMNMTQELQDFKKDGQGLGYASNQEIGYDDGFTDTEYRTKGSRASKIDHEHSNMSFDDPHEVNEDIRRGERVVETKCLKTRQEVVEYMNMPQQAGEELKNFEDSPSLGYASNQENNDGIIDTVCMEVLEDGGGLRDGSNQVNSSDNGFTDTEYVELPEEDIEEAQIYSGIRVGKQEKSNTFKAKQDAEKVAIELLAKRAYTVVELRKKLNAKYFPVKVVDAVVSDFRDRGLINDSLYAEVYSHSRWNSSSWGPKRIKQALVKKGVSKGKVEKAVKLVFEDDEDCDQRSGIRLSNSSLQKLYEQASKQWQRSHSAPHETRKARLIRWLQYRGFDWGVVSFILKKLKA